MDKKWLWSLPSQNVYSDIRIRKKEKERTKNIFHVLLFSLSSLAIQIRVTESQNCSSHLCEEINNTNLRSGRFLGRRFHPTGRKQSRMNLRKRSVHRWTGYYYISVRIIIQLLFSNKWRRIHKWSFLFSNAQTLQMASRIVSSDTNSCKAGTVSQKHRNTEKGNQRT